jgi:cell division protein FtsI (penicillin-binding protein 3)
MMNRQMVTKRGRLIIIVVFFFWVIFGFRAAQIQILDHKIFLDYADSQQKATMPLSAKRGSIYDCNGRLIAYDIEASSYTVNPKYMKRPSDAAAKIASITGQPKSYWMQQFAKRPGFLMVARRVPQDQKYQFDNSGIETLRERSETLRYYPYDKLAAEVIGRTDVDNIGVSGLEMYYDKYLRGTDGQSIYLRDAYGKEVTSWEQTLVPPQNGSDLYLTLDLNFQEIVQDEMQKMLDSSQAIWGTSIFLDVETGGVLASVTVERDQREFVRCRAIADMNEPGSTAKIVPLSTVFENRIVEPDDIINVEGGKCMIGGHLIKDDHAHGLLRCTEVGVYSSNIGAAKLGIKAGADLIYKQLVKYGFGARTNIDFPGEAPGVLYKPSEWTTHNLAIICFGYGMSTTALQLVDAYGAVASGGELHRPYFATKVVAPDSTEQILNSKMVVRDVIDKRTVNIMQGVFRDVVLEGTAKKAKDELCPISGKTGTALRAKIGGKGYETHKALASFVGYFPSDAPKIVGIVMFDSPTFSIYGGDVAAPVFKNIAKRYAVLPGNNFMAESNLNPDTLNKVMQAGANGGAKIVQASAKKILAPAGEPKKKPIIGGFHDFTGQTMRDALRTAKNMGLSPKIVGSGRVISQTPPAGTDTTGVTNIELIGEAR